MKSSPLAAVLAMTVAFLLGGEAALGHGGSHPTPWPSPTPTPTPRPTPRPTPPTPTPTAKPVPTPGPGIKRRSTWQDWWLVNGWRFTRTTQKRRTVTGGEGDELGELRRFLTAQLDHNYFDIRSAAAMALGKAQALDSYAAIQKLVKDRNPVVAESAVLALGMMGHRRSLPFLLGMAINKKQSTRNRVHAVISLGLVGDEASCRKLADLALRSNDEDEVKAACLIALSLLRDEPAGALFIGRLAAERVRPALKAVAATALGKLGCKELRFARRPVVTVKYLAHLLRTQKKNAQLRQSAALALGALDLASEVDPQQLLRVIAPALDDSDWDTANFTLMAVAEIGRGGHGGDAAWSLIRRRLRRRDHAVLGYACIATGLSRDRDSIPTLRRLLTSGPSPGIRAAAAIGLGLMGDMGATPAMLKIINGKGDTVLRGYCCTALGIMNISKNDEALPTIKRVLRTESAPDLRAAAAMALARVGDRDALDTLLASLKDGNQYFRMSAVVAIGSFRHLRAVGPLMELFKAKNVNNELRAIICVALGNIAEPTSVPVLRRISKHYNFRLARFQILLQIVRLL